MLMVLVTLALIATVVVLAFKDRTIEPSISQLPTRSVASPALDASACEIDLKTIGVVVEAYYAQNGRYPPNLVPSLTRRPHVFLRPQTGLSGDTLTTAAYTITYTPATGEVDSGGVC